MLFMSSHDGQALIRKPGMGQVSPLEIKGVGGGGGWRFLEDKRYFSRAIRPSSLGPHTVGISRRKHFPAPLIPCHQTSD